MKLMKPSIIFWGTSAFVLVLAQLLKDQFPGAVYNHQLAFGISWPDIWIVPTIVLFLGAIVWWFYHTLPTVNWATLSFGLVLGGGLSNLLERIINAGLVTDYWNMASLFTFNLADVSISIGIVGLMVYFLHVRT